MASRVVNALQAARRRRSATPPKFKPVRELPRQMRAATVTEFGPEVNVRLKMDVPFPKKEDNSVVINIRAAGVNPADSIYREGHFPKVKVPFIPGLDGAGVVVDVGDEVQRFKVGDRVVAVFTSGSYSEYATAKDYHVGNLYDNISYEEGAGIGVPYYTAYAAVHFKAQAQPGETVLVHGATGAVGLACVQVLKAHGCNVIGTAGSREGEQHLKNYGTDLVFNHNEKGYVDAIMQMTGPNGIHAILEMASSTNIRHDLNMVAIRGRIVVVGTNGNVQFDPLQVIVKQVTINGVNLYGMNEAEWDKLHAAVFAGQREGWVRPYIGQVYRLIDAGRAQWDLKNKKGVKGKLIVSTTT